MMNVIVKGDTMGKRENKLYSNQGINRLERDLEKSSKQLQTELTRVRESQNELLNEETLKELEGLFGEVDEYFRQKHINLKDRVNYSV